MEMVKDLQIVPIDTLIPYANNARTHSKEQIKKLQSSLREFGFVSPIIVDEQYTILCGHGRYEACKAEGYQEVPCVIETHLSEAQRKAYILADNRMALDAGWDEELLGVELAELQDLGFDLDLTGFREDEYASLMAGEEEVEDDGFDLSTALEQASFVERGDRWTLGVHTLLCGDATCEEDMQVLMGDKRANLLLTDPPYGVSFTSASGLTIQNDSIKGEAFYSFLLNAFQNSRTHMENNAVAYVFYSDSESVNFRRAFDDAGFHLSETCIWVKDSMVLGRSDYQWRHEPILYGFVGKGGKHHWYADRKQTTVWEFGKPKKNSIHPTMKPLDLLSYPIQNSTQENSIVLDPFGGSGSTLMACERMGRICYSMELDEKYASAILRRYVELTDKPEEVSVLREGKTYPYSSLVKELERDV